MTLLQSDKILYIHGFASCGDSTKTKLLKNYFGFETIIAPDVAVAPHEAIRQLESLIETHNISLLIGSSLGAYYATYLSEKYQIKAVLINPSTKPYETLAPYVGENTFWCSGLSFIWKNSYVNDLYVYECREINVKRYFLLLKTGDELLNYTLAQKKYEGAQMIIEEGGNHRFENLQIYLEDIEAFR